MHNWWIGLSSESKTAIIAAVVGAAVGPIVSELLGVRVRLIRWFYIRALEQLDRARRELHAQIISGIRVRAGGSIDDSEIVSISIEKVAKKAGISLWRARKAEQWIERARKYGS